ncbi:tetratricopeptide repeat protein [Shewanella algae]|uniref:tetratricopeptide repeat protein n=1 Tax=Shewanella algae TaxID=38313 RepID=UPI003999BA50
MGRLVLSIVGALFLVTAITGCAHRAQITPTLPLANSDIFITGTYAHLVPSEHDFLRLSNSQKQSFQDFLSNPDIAKLPNYLKLSLYINGLMQGFNYEGKNLMAAEAIRQRQGNCMTLAMLTFALAKELNVPVGFQLVHTPPILLDVSQGVALYSNHVRSFLYESTPVYGHYGSQGHHVVVDYFPDGNDRSGAFIDESTFIGMFYRNLAVDALQAQKTEKAFLLIQEGLKFSPDYVPLINLMAVMHRRAGDWLGAERFYRYGLALDQEEITLLTNYRILLEREGRISEVNIITERLRRLSSPQPYDNYLLGIDALAQNQYELAEDLLERFIRDNEYFHRAYLALARSQLAQGKTSLAKRNLQKALNAASDNSYRNIYAAKLAALKSK